MKTEFALPFTFDTGPIEQRLQERGYEEVIGSITKDAYANIRKALPKTYGGVDWYAFLYDIASKFVDSHADEIIDMTAELLARKVGNRKRWREVIEEIRKEREED